MFASIRPLQIPRPVAAVRKTLRLGCRAGRDDPVPPPPVKLSARVERQLRRSPEVRHELRTWLNAVEADFWVPTWACPDDGPPSAPAPPGGDVYFNGARAFYDADPCDFRWELCEGAEGEEPFVLYCRRFPIVTVTLRYFYESGAVTLMYPAALHPNVATGRYLEDYSERERDAWEADGIEGLTLLMLERFEGLEEWEFQGVLKYTPCWFGRGCDVEVVDGETGEAARGAASDDDELSE